MASPRLALSSATMTSSQLRDPDVKDTVDVEEDPVVALPRGNWRRRL
ncbi:hypothetical protein EVJ58_g10382 [Rhodofomes roseus]|uniref:Uncharacterized protein n=1 Tax=Rhodofomes roseus TaxID=34475 RepID=A0A4Y9XRI0_9APHY|nr:hypothetical protein EVJ58_g10382 [Rhodofomes roseus]